MYWPVTHSDDKEWCMHLMLSMYSVLDDTLSRSFELSEHVMTWRHDAYPDTRTSNKHACFQEQSTDVPMQSLT